MTHNLAYKVQHIHPLLWHLIDGLHDVKFAEDTTGYTPAPSKHLCSILFFEHSENLAINTSLCISCLQDFAGTSGP